ncbi:MAG: DNA polymerase IV [Gammaproteobacteria bacterium]|nr:DNA polymerase IV [Gammaproteobacteria bacterium]
MSSHRFILHVDMDAFYASVEVREQPGLAGRPVIVGGLPRGRGVVSAANYEARRFGIHSAMPTARAMRLCPHAVCLPVRMNLYTTVSRQIREIFNRYTPLVEPLSLDEAFLDVTASMQLFGTATEIANAIKQAISNELSLVASVGIAPNKFIAKIASDLDKPDGFVEVKPEDVQVFLDPLPVSRVWGVGKATGKELDRLGITSIAHLRQQSEAVLQDRFGKFGSHLWRLAHGIDDRPVVSDSEAKSISNETTFDSDISNHDTLRAWLMELTEQVCWRLRQHELYGRTVQIKLRFHDFSTISRSHTLPEATQQTKQVWQVVMELFDKATQSESRPLRLVGVGVSSLSDEAQRSQVQTDMFDQPKDTHQTQLDEVTDAIKSRFGSSGIRRGTGCKQH